MNKIPAEQPAALAIREEDGEAPAPKAPRHDAAGPKQGWTVCGFMYTTNHGLPEQVHACMYLAQDELGVPQCCQWWCYSEPTKWHGSWAAENGSMWISFNCFGPTYDNGRPRRMRTTYLGRVDHGVWEGKDEQRRKIRLEQYGSWTGVQRGENLCWAPTAEERPIHELFKEPAAAEPAAKKEEDK